MGVLGWAEISPNDQALKNISANKCQEWLSAKLTKGGTPNIQPTRETLMVSDKLGPKYQGSGPNVAHHVGTQHWLQPRSSGSHPHAEQDLKGQVLLETTSGIQPTAYSFPPNLHKQETIHNQVRYTTQKNGLHLDAQGLYCDDWCFLYRMCPFHAAEVDSHVFKCPRPGKQIQGHKADAKEPAK